MMLNKRVGWMRRMQWAISLALSIISFAVCVGEAHALGAVGTRMGQPQRQAVIVNLNRRNWSQTKYFQQPAAKPKNRFAATIKDSQRKTNKIVANNAQANPTPNSKLWTVRLQVNAGDSANKKHVSAAERLEMFDFITQSVMRDERARLLRPQVLKLAILAHQRSRQLGVASNKPIITLIDYSLPSTQRRLWVIDLKRGKVLHHSLVAHGKNSGKSRYTRTFSNRNGSLMTSLGVFLTEDAYFGKDGYSLRLQGLERGINDNAKKRYIVMHGSPYVSERIAAKAGRVGCSWGCPAVEQHLAKPIINTIKGGSLIFSFYPDRHWLQHSRFLIGHC